MSLVDLRYQKERRNKEELLKHLREFELDLKFSVGIWYFTPSGGRFHENYVEPKSIPEKIKMAYDMAKFGVKGIEAHYPVEVNEDNLHLYKKLEKDTGIRLVLAGAHIFYEKMYEFGSLSNPKREIRKNARNTLIGTLKLVKEAGADMAVIWPGIDGYTYSLGTVFYQMWDWFEEEVAQAMDEVPGVRVAIEPKPYEPIPNNIYRTTSDGIIAAQGIEAKLSSPENKKLLEEGHTLVGLNPEMGHIRMGFEDLPYALSRVAREGRLAHTHWNSQPLGNYDQDLNVGVVGWEQTEAALYALKLIGYRGYFGIDINPERIPIQKAIEINTKVLNIMNERINQLPHHEILECYFDPENHRGELELILAEARRT